MPADDAPRSGLSRLLHLAAGFAAGCGVILLVLLLALAGVPVGTAFWAGVFLAFWAALFTLLRFNAPWAVAGLTLGLAAGYLVLARVFGF